MLYCEKDLDITVIIISVDGDYSKIEKIYNSTNFLSKNYKSIALIPDGRSIEPCSCKVYTGGNCITSLIDFGIEKADSEWAYCVFSGSVIKKSIDKKLGKYVETEKDVLFPVVNRIWNFIDGSMNGILINKNFYQSVGKFGSGNTLQNTKLMWAERALEKGVQFKAIVNACNL